MLYSGDIQAQMESGDEEKRHGSLYVPRGAFMEALDVLAEVEHGQG